jgi:hypothetical protein
MYLVKMYENEKEHHLNKLMFEYTNYFIISCFVMLSFLIFNEINFY